MSEKTVAAISTPKGQGGIAIVRISGEEAIAVADKCFVSASGRKIAELSGYSALFGKVKDSSGAAIDEAVALLFRAPKSYTGENVVEISVHGGIVPARECLKAVYAAGAYPAGAGEFKKRAFLNGKIDLSNAEGVMEIIGARSSAALGIARGAKEGKISREIDNITEKMLFAASSIAAYSDFPDEDIEGLDFEHFSAMLEECEEALYKLLSTFEGGQAVLSGVPTAIVGKPNVGKSTLMNMLSREERSIVTDKAGTTRDIVETSVLAGDISLILSDTAGIRDTEDEIEQIGVDKAVKKLNTAALVLAVFDLSKPLDNEDGKLLSLIKDKRVIAVLNKSDLPQKADTSRFKGLNTVSVAAKEGKGLDNLIEKIAEVCGADKLTGDEAVLLNERQYSCVLRAKEAITEAKKDLLSGVTLDAVGVLIDDALNALLELSGKRASEDVVEEIFKNFCIGK